MRRVLLLALMILLVLSNSGCWHFRIGPSDFEFARPPESRSDAEAILRVNEAGIPWANGTFAPAIQKELLARGIFREVYYPVEPASPPSTVIEVSGIGDLDEAVVWATIASAATGYFFFLPAPVLPYFQDYEAQVDVTVKRDGEVLGTFSLDDQAAIVHALFASPNGYVPPARRALLKKLAREIVAGVENVLN